MNARAALVSIPSDVGPVANYLIRTSPIPTGGSTAPTPAAAGSGYAILASQDTIVARFHGLVRKWQEDTEHVSILADMILHPSYQEIVGMGPAAIPLLLDELEREPNHWFPALFAISGGQNPVPDAAAGDMDKMVEAWLEWAKENSYR
jgi:hypothetical protein